MSDVATATPSNGASPTPVPVQTAEAPAANQLDSLTEKQKNDILADMNQKFQQAAMYRVRFDKQWYMNLSFYFGRQWVSWVGEGNFESMKLYEPPAPRWRVRLVSNKIKPIIRNELTKLTKEETQYYVVPETTEDEDLMAARAAEACGEYLFQECKMPATKRRATFWALLCGTSFLKTYYDANKPDSSGTPGSIILEAVNAFHMFVPELDEEEIENQPWVMQTGARDPEWVESTFGLTAAPDVSTGAGTFEQRLLSGLGLNNTASKEQVYVKEAWVRPCKKYPDGGLITFTSSRLLSYVPYWPYKRQEYPYAKIDHIPTGRFYGESTIVDLIPLQREYNRTRSQLVESKNRMAKPQLIAPKGSIDPSKITSEPGLIITYTPGFQPPQPIQLSPIPQYVIEELDRTSRDIDENAGQFEVTKGKTPPGVEAASAIAYLQEENDTRLAHTVFSLEEAVEKTGRLMLSLVNEYWDIPRTVRVIGKNNQFEAMAIKRQDLAANIDFRVEAGSSAPVSRAAKQAFLTEIGKLQWVPPQKLLRYLGMVETNRLYDDMNIDNRAAERENVKMRMLGVPLPINEFDNDPVHIEEHQKYCKGQEYESMQPQQQEVFLQHLRLHMARYQAMMAQSSMNQQQQPSGQPPQEPMQ